MSKCLSIFQASVCSGVNPCGKQLRWGASLKAVPGTGCVVSCHCASVVRHIKGIEGRIRRKCFAHELHRVSRKQKITNRDEALSLLSVPPSAGNLHIVERGKLEGRTLTHAHNTPGLSSSLEVHKSSRLPAGSPQLSVIAVQRLIRTMDTLSTKELLIGLELVGSTQRQLQQNQEATGEVLFAQKSAYCASRNMEPGVKGRVCSPKIGQRMIRKFLLDCGSKKITSFPIGSEGIPSAYLTLLCSFACARIFKKLLLRKRFIQEAPVDVLVRGVMACSRLTAVAKQQSCYNIRQPTCLNSTIDSAARILQNGAGFTMKCPPTSPTTRRQLQSKSRAFTGPKKELVANRVFPCVHNATSAPAAPQPIQCTTDYFVMASVFVSAVLWKKIREELAPRIHTLLIDKALRSASTNAPTVLATSSIGAASPVASNGQSSVRAFQEELVDPYLAFAVASNRLSLASLAVLLRATRMTSLSESKRRKLILNVLSRWQPHPDVLFLDKAPLTVLRSGSIKKCFTWTNKYSSSLSAIAKVCHTIVVERVHLPLSHVEAIGRTLFQAFHRLGHVMHSCTAEKGAGGVEVWHHHEWKMRDIHKFSTLEGYQHSWERILPLATPGPTDAEVRCLEEDSKSSVAGDEIGNAVSTVFCRIYSHLSLGIWALVRLLLSATKECLAVQLNRLPILPHLMLLVDRIEQLDPSDVAQIADTLRVLLQSHHKVDVNYSACLQPGDATNNNSHDCYEGVPATTGAAGTKTLGFTMSKHRHFLMRQSLLPPRSLVVLLQKIARAVVERSVAFGYIELLSVLRLYVQLDLLLCLDLNVQGVSICKLRSSVPYTEIRLSTRRFIYHTLMRLCIVHPWYGGDGKPGTARACLSGYHNRRDPPVGQAVYDQHVLNALTVKYPHIIRKQPKQARRLLTQFPFSP